MTSSELLQIDDSEAVSNQPSRVIHFRGINTTMNQVDILQLTQSFGKVTNLIFLKNSHQALLEFQDLNSAIAFMNAHSSFVPYIRGAPIYPQYSNHKALVTTDTSERSKTEPSRVLLVKIINAQYPITVDVLSQVFSPYEVSPRGTVEKIIVFAKAGGQQALVQYSTIECATRAMRALNLRNIYTNCCTLQIQFSKRQEINVQNSSEKSFDFTAALGEEKPPMYNSSSQQRQMPLQVQHIPQVQGLISNPGYQNILALSTQQQQQLLGNVGGMGAIGGFGGTQSVLLVSGFPPEHVGCQELFNVFSNYGTVMCVKVLFNKPNMALVQFADSSQAKQALNYLHRVQLFGHTLEIVYSKYSSIVKPAPGHQTTTPPTPGATRNVQTDPKTVDYDSSSLNRYHKYGEANARHLSRPTNTLHVSNVAASVDEAALLDHIGQSTGTPVAVKNVKIYETNGKRMALAQFEDQSSAVEAMCLLHNTPLQGKNIRLTFTKNHIQTE
ncbi:MAG: putative Polypyrimidine tract-binding protein [Streblomastix strix]|uniref:Putative Polypyrimidine tract-binding protein n=1 Tax=Streblomastix strix TaxID=222440 RepID=A0A5J4X1H8_9EUKA|nr:MAG: putative Polypyrimidine tract-binding protein [Streblomastix strix]